VVPRRVAQPPRFLIMMMHMRWKFRNLEQSNGKENKDVINGALAWWPGASGNVKCHDMNQSIKMQPYIPPLAQSIIYLEILHIVWSSNLYMSVFVLPTSNGVCKITLSCSEMAKLKSRDKCLAWFGPLFER